MQKLLESGNRWRPSAYKLENSKKKSKNDARDFALLPTVDNGRDIFNESDSNNIENHENNSEVMSGNDDSLQKDTPFDIEFSSMNLPLLDVRKEKKALKLNVLRGLEPSFKETGNRKRQSEDKLENTT